MTEEQKLINVQIRKRLQTVRENMGYTQEAFAEVLSVDAGHYQKLERGLYGLSTDKLLTLYERYRIDPTYLITGEKNQTFDVELFLANCDRAGRFKSEPPEEPGASSENGGSSVLSIISI